MEMLARLLELDNELPYRKILHQQVMETRHPSRAMGSSVVRSNIPARFKCKDQVSVYGRTERCNLIVRVNEQHHDQFGAT